MTLADVKKNLAILFWFALIVPGVSTGLAWAQDAQTIVQQSFDYFRGDASISTVQMTIHRPKWERHMEIKAWTKGQTESLFSITAPAKDYGNGTLKKGREMWIYNPKVNRIIKVPPSMMSQSWMGSDFSNNDLAKSDSILTDYEHKVVGTENHDGRILHVIRSLPKPQAPVVWGMQLLKIREDHIWLVQEFFDEDLKSVKVLETLDVQMLGGRLFPKVWRIRKSEEPDHYTRLTYLALEFKPTLPESLFTLSSLRTRKR